MVLLYDEVVHIHHAISLPGMVAHKGFLAVFHGGVSHSL